MIPSNPICPVCNYATNPTYCQLPSADQLQCGVVPLDSLPAAWWNALWNQTNAAVNQARGAVGALITEVNNVLQGAGVCVNPSCTDQLYQAIDKIRQTIGSASVAGAVKSSSCPGEVSIDANGIMTANCVGNAASLTTTARTVVGAVNELKQVYDCCFSDTDTAIGGKAPNMHASSATTYGVGNASCYGHLKISDEYTCCVGNAADGIAASQLALYCVYDYAAGIAAGVAALGNTAGCALGTAAAGTAVTAARSDHVHPVPYYLATYKASGTNNVSALQNIFSSVTKSVGTAVRLEKSSHSMAFGWFLDDYDYSHAYGGWFISDYGVPVWVGVDNGCWTSATFITSNNIGSQHVCFATYAGAACESCKAYCACCAYGTAYYNNTGSIPTALFTRALQLRFCSGAFCGMAIMDYRGGTMAPWMPVMGNCTIYLPIH